MASRSLAASLVRRSFLSRRGYHVTTVQNGGATPPLPPFARNLAPSETLAENSDALWNDGVAPELALDFDLPNVSSQEALMTWAGAFGLFGLLYQGISFWTDGAKDENPALSHATDVVIPDYSRVANPDKK